MMYAKVSTETTQSWRSTHEAWLRAKKPAEMRKIAKKTGHATRGIHLANTKKDARIESNRKGCTVPLVSSLCTSKYIKFVLLGS